MATTKHFASFLSLIFHIYTFGNTKYTLKTLKSLYLSAVYIKPDKEARYSMSDLILIVTEILSHQQSIGVDLSR